MQHQAMRSQSLGADLRRARGPRLAERLARSVGWLSQVERDVSEPSIPDPRNNGSGLEVPLSTLFGPSPAPLAEAGHMVRRGVRRPPGSGKLDPEIAGQRHTLHPGASFRIRGAPFRRDNPFDEKAGAIRVIASPVY